MVLKTIYNLILVIILAQSILCKPALDTSSLIETKVKTSNPEKELFLNIDNFVNTIREYGVTASKISENLLKEESLKAHTGPEVLEFKRNLNLFLTKYDPSTKNMKTIYDALSIFANRTYYYYQLPQNKLAPDWEFIIAILNEYKCRDLVEDMNIYINEFFNKIKQMFEENRNEYEKPVVEWFEKFITLTEMKQKFYAFADSAIYKE